MHTRKLHISLALTLLALVGALTLLGSGNSSPPTAQAQGPDGYTTYYVAPAGSNCGGMTPCYTTVQAAVDAVDDPGDVVKVAAGTYTGVQTRNGLDQAVYITKSLTIRGGYSTSDWNHQDPEAHVTTLNANGQGRVVYIAGAISVTVDGLHLTGGDATGLGGDGFGDAGGGVYVLSATVTLSRNTIGNNQATTDSWSDGLGGGVYADASTITLRGNQILNNRAAVGGWFASGMGGGVYGVDSQVLLEANQIRGNQAGGDFGVGGGVELDACAGFTLVNNVVADNQADYGGAGVWISHMSGVPSTGRLIHTTIARNQGANDADGVRVAGGSVVTLTNTILVGHDTGINVSFGSTGTLTATLWSNTTDWGDVGVIYTGVLNYWGDPAFLNPGAGNYHISSSSAAKDRGVDAGVTTDLDGNPRDAQPDLGAYEAGSAGALQAVKTASAALLNPGDTLTYTVVVTNAGTGSMTNVVVTDTLPVLQRPLTASSDKGDCTIVNSGYGGQVRCTMSSLGGNQTAHITITAQVNPTAPASLPQTMRNTAQATSDQATDPTTVYADTVLQDCRACVNGGATRYSTVQAAVDAAPAGSTVWIAGTCVGATARAGHTQQVYLDQNLTLRGGYRADFAAWDPAAYPTTLDATGQGRVIYVAGPANVTIEALTLTGGDATGQGGDAFVSDDMGGGVYVVDATVTLSRTQVISNVASTQFSGLGGGVGVTTATLTLVDSTLSGNTATSATLGLGYGGGLAAEAATVHLERCRVEGNTAATSLAGLGGGAYLYDSDLVGQDSLWLSNRTSNLGWGWGGGLYVVGAAPFTLTNCVVADNQADDGGSGLLVDGAAGVLLHPTIAGNQGGAGVEGTYTATVVITNAVVVSHSVGVRATEGSDIAINGVLWYDNISNTVSVTATIQASQVYTGAPAFAADGYHITAASEARDRGVVSGVPTDIDGELRPFGPAYDLGADEYTCYAVTDVALAGPTGATVGSPQTFTATVGPVTVTQPITYTWQATGQATQVRNINAISDTVSYTWDVAGTKAVTVTAVNECGVMVSATRSIVIETGKWYLYLPLVLRQ